MRFPNSAMGEKRMTKGRKRGLITLSQRIKGRGGGRGDGGPIGSFIGEEKEGNKKESATVLDSKRRK